MPQTENKNKIKGILSIIGFFAFLPVLSPSAYAQIQSPNITGNTTTAPDSSTVTANGQVKLEDGFSEKYQEFLKNLPVDLAFQSDENFVDAPLYFAPPLSNIGLTTKSDKQTLQGGENLNIAGKLTFGFEGDKVNNVAREACQKEIKNNSHCGDLNLYYSALELKKVNVFGQIFRRDPKSDKGDFLVDEFYALENKDLKNGEYLDFNVSWPVPKNIESGNYYLSLYVNSDKKFDLLGLPIVAMSEAARSDFEVKSNTKEVSLDKDNIKINNTAYAYRRPAPTVEGEKINVTVPLKNGFDVEKEVKIKYELMRWGQVDPRDILETKDETRELSAGSADNLNFSFSPNDSDSVYNLKITAVSDDAKSVANIRFVAESKNRGIFRQFALLADTQHNRYFPYFCVRDAQWQGAFNGKVKISVLDWSGTPLANHEETTRLIPEDNCFVWKNGPVDLGTGSKKILGEIFNDKGILVDRAELVYESGSDAKAEAASAKTGKTAGEKSSPKSKVLLGAVVIILVLSIILIIIGGLIILKTNWQKNEKK